MRSSACAVALIAIRAFGSAYPHTAALHKLRNRPAEPIARPTSEMGPTRRPFLVLADSPGKFRDPPFLFISTRPAANVMTRRSEGVQP
jgi:hypothetical protein